jgi:hypothetical protein
VLQSHPHRVRVRVTGATIFVTINNQALRLITIDDDGGFARRRGLIGFAGYNLEPDCDAFGARFWNFSVVARDVETQPPARLESQLQDRWQQPVPRAWEGIDPKQVYSQGGTGNLARDPVTGAIVYCCAKQPGYLATSSDLKNGFCASEHPSPITSTHVLRGLRPGSKSLPLQPKALEAYRWTTNAIREGGSINLTKIVKINSTSWSPPRVVASVMASSLAAALCVGAPMSNRNDKNAVADCLRMVNASTLSTWTYGGGGTPLLVLPSGELLLFANFCPPTGITNLNGRRYWEPFATWSLEGAIRNTTGGESWSDIINIDRRPSREGGYTSGEDSKGGFAPMLMFAVARASSA